MNSSSTQTPKRPAKPSGNGEDHNTQICHIEQIFQGLEAAIYASHEMQNSICESFFKQFLQAYKNMKNHQKIIEEKIAQHEARIEELRSVKKRLTSTSDDLFMELSSLGFSQVMHSQVGVIPPFDKTAFLQAVKALGTEEAEWCLNFYKIMEAAAPVALGPEPEFLSSPETQSTIALILESHRKINELTTQKGTIEEARQKTSQQRSPVPLTLPVPSDGRHRFRNYFGIKDHITTSALPVPDEDKEENTP